MKNLVLIVTAFLGLSAGSASATCTSPATMHDFPGATFLMSLATNAGDGNCASNVGIIGNLPPFASAPTFNLGTLNGAATAAKQPALGAAGTPSADVISVQGVSGGTPQPISAASGADVSEGSIADTVCAATGNVTVTGCLRQAVQLLGGAVPLGSASGGMSTKTLAALSNTAIAVKASAGQVYSAQCTNSDATHFAFIQIFNVAAASVTMGTTAPAKFVGIPPASNAGFTFSLVGNQYATAISAGAATTATGGTAPTTAIDCTVDFN
jgi:hypothetical protein